MEKLSGDAAKRGGPFYRRVDNLVPLLKAYESILGSCDENLVKNPGELSTFKADDVFYYAKGVAIAMGTILEALAVDCDDTIGSVQGMDVIHHAVEALHHASNLDPWIVLEGSPDGIWPTIGPTSQLPSAMPVFILTCCPGH